jgi:hypothetical protein
MGNYSSSDIEVGQIWVFHSSDSLYYCIIWGRSQTNKAVYNVLWLESLEFGSLHPLHDMDRLELVANG